MNICFKRLNDFEDFYYTLDIKYGDHGEFIYYVDNDPNKGTVVGNVIQLEKHSTYDYKSHFSPVYVTPYVFENEFYPIVLKVGGKVETLIKEAQDARIKSETIEKCSKVEEFFKSIDDYTNPESSNIGEQDIIENQK